MKVLYSRTQAAAGHVTGGALAHTLGVIDGLSRLGELAIITNESIYGIDGLEQHISVETVKPVGSRGWGELLYNAYYPPQLSARIIEFRPDFVYHRFGGLSYATARVCKQLDVPLVLEFNSSSVWGLRQRLHSSLDKLLALPKQYILRWVELYNLQAAFLIVVPARPLKDHLLERGFLERKILVNPNAVNPAKFQPASPQVCLDIRRKLGIDADRIAVGFAGSFSFWHGIPELAEAITRLNSDPVRRRQLFFVLYGDGRLGPMIVNSIAHYENVLFTGKIEYAHIQDYLSICDILLSPHGRPPDDERSVGWPGASPTKLFEYMALGKGIVASNLDHIGQALQDGQTGLLVPPGDVDALVQGISYLADHPDEATRMGRSARRMVCEQHTWEQHTRRILERFAALRAAGAS